MAEEVIEKQIEDISAEDLDFLGGELFNEPEEEKETPLEIEEDKEDKAEKDKGKSKEVEEEEELEDKPKDEEEEVTVFSRTSFKKIEEKFPDFFKTFPDLRHAIGREKAFTELFPTVEDAKESKENAEDFAYLRDEILQGKVETLFSSVKEVDQASYKKVVNNFLPELYRTDRDSFYSITEPLIGNALANVFKTATDENLKNACEVLAHHFFGDANIAKTGIKVADTSTKTDPERDQLEKDKREYQYSKFVDAKKGIEQIIVSKCKARLAEEIFKPDDKIDKELKQILIDKAFSSIDTQLGSSKIHKDIVDGIWTRAIKAGSMTDPLKNRLVSTYLSRAESLIPQLRAKIRKMALNSRVLDKQKIEQEEKKSQSRESTNSSRNGNKNYKGMSDLEIISEE